MSFPYQHVLIIGATSGIGAAMAEKFIQERSKVIVTGRRADRLDAFVAKHGKGKASGIPFDVTNTQGVDAFVQSVTRTHPDIDCVILNAGTMHQVDLSKPEKVDMIKFHSLMNINYTGLVNLAVAFLPFLMGKPSSLIFTGSHVSFVPAAGLSAYCASKSALATFALCLREEIRESSVKVVDLWPPPVQSEIHDNLASGDGRAFGMPVGDFTNEAYAELAAGKEAIIIGTGPAEKSLFDSMVFKRNELTVELAKVMRASNWGH